MAAHIGLLKQTAKTKEEFSGVVVPRNRMHAGRDKSPLN